MRVYLDNNATTALDPRALDAMLPFLSGPAGNAASPHLFGQIAREGAERAREQVAALLCAQPREIFFTSGSTEANNLALKGIAGGTAPTGRRRLVSCATEHPAILEPLGALARRGFDVVLVPSDSVGVVDLDALSEVVDEHTLLVTIMAANNETGTLAPLSEVANLTRRAGALLHCDATQLLSWGPLDVEKIGVDLLSVSAHKLHGPQGVGALYISRLVDCPLEPLFHGGGHERGLRSGTTNTPGLVGFGVAAELAATEGMASVAPVRTLRDRLHAGLAARLDGVELNGHPDRRLPGTVNLAFAGADADAVMAGVGEIAIATGSACSTGVPGPSHVLSAMGHSSVRAENSLRFSLSRQTTGGEVDYVIGRVAESVVTVRRRTAGVEVPV